MDAIGQTYFDSEEDLPEEDIDRLRRAIRDQMDVKIRRAAEDLELARKAQEGRDRRLAEELQRALGSTE